MPGGKEYVRVIGSHGEVAARLSSIREEAKSRAGGIQQVDGQVTLCRGLEKQVEVIAVAEVRPLEAFFRAVAQQAGGEFHPCLHDFPYSAGERDAYREHSLGIGDGVNGFPDGFQPFPSHFTAAQRMKFRASLPVRVFDQRDVTLCDPRAESFGNGLHLGPLHGSTFGFL